ncbi:unnamed protein product, partial [Choristocarpus tenellus]
MAASVLSLGSVITHPGHHTAGDFSVSTNRSRPGTCCNREPLVGNTLCFKANIERTKVLHEARLSSIKGYLRLSSPVRLSFIDKRISKNFHHRRQQEQVAHENLKILRALEEIHFRSESQIGGGLGLPGRLSKTRSSSSGSGVDGNKMVLAKLNGLMARKRDLEAIRIARENHKMAERMTQSRSVYSAAGMRKHRLKQRKLIRLRKTDYTAGHLLCSSSGS